jgi:hypothetical protein
VGPDGARAQAGLRGVPQGVPGGGQAERPARRRARRRHPAQGDVPVAIPEPGTPLDQGHRSDRRDARGGREGAVSGTPSSPTSSPRRRPCSGSTTC